MKIIGLTGGIGSGKTTVANMFAQLGVPVYIADVEAKKLTDSSKTIKRKIIELLGEESYSNGVLDRKFVADKIFNNAALREAVNAIVHPKVAEHFKNWSSQQNSEYVIEEAAILFENGSYKNCDLVILVTAPKKERIERVNLRDGSTEKEILQRMESQWSDKKKKKLADFIIENISLKSTQNKVEAIHKILSKPL